MLSQKNLFVALVLGTLIVFGTLDAFAAFVDGTGPATFSNPTPNSAFYSNNPNGAGGDIAGETGSPSQSAANIEDLIEALFPQTAGSLTLVAETAPPAPLGGAFSGTISNASPFNYAAVHNGNEEYVLQFSPGTTSFDFANLGFGLSNYRLFSAPVPIPSSVLLFGTGLLGLVGWRWWSTKTT